MITQNQIDGIAHFLEAAISLLTSRFFLEDTRSLTFTGHSTGTSKPVVQLSDEEVFKAVLIPFRRIWQEGEPSQFFVVCNVLHQFAGSPQERGLIRHTRDHYNKACSTFSPSPSDIELGPREVINLFINTKYMHTGGKARSGRQRSRADFDNLQAKVGIERLTWLFHSSVFNLIVHISNIADLAYSALVFLHDNNSLKPSFRFESNPRVKVPWQTDESANIQRHTIGVSDSFESELNRIQRYLRRREFEVLAWFLENIEFPLVHLNQLTILSSDSIHNLTGIAGAELEAKDGEWQSETNDSGLRSMNSFLDPKIGLTERV